MARYSINRKALFLQISTAEPVLKKEAERIIREYYFDPAVDKMKREFNNHPVTEEIDGGMGSKNISKTLQGDFIDDDCKNLTSFIGFDVSAGSPTNEIRDRLDPTHRDGPKMTYKKMDKEKLNFIFEIQAPNQEAIYKKTPLPWADGISWAKRIEVGIAGLGQFLNTREFNSPNPSRSGGGIQVDVKLRTGRYVATKYLSEIFNNFIKNVAKRGKR